MLKIKDRKIGYEYPPYIVAELSANHNGSIHKAMEAIKLAKENGADAIKIQTYTPDTMTIDCDKSDFKIHKGLWKNYTMYDLYKWAHTPFEWHKELFNYSKEIDMCIFSTPFDESAVELLEKLETPAYKIASPEITDLILIKQISQTKKPILISTGMASKKEISEAVETVYKEGNNPLLLFHCISCYPTPIEYANLKKILKLKQEFNLDIGLSDHTLGNTAAITSVAFGASAIEKHFTVSRKDNTPDSDFSMEPDDLLNLVKETKNAWLSLGNDSYERPKEEEENKIFRRSIYFTKDLKSGDVINKNNIKRIRPGFGLEPKYYEEIIGKKINKDVLRGTPVSWNLIER